MGKTKPKDQLLEAVNCTLPQEDVQLAKTLGTSVVKGKEVVNTSLGFRRVFQTVRVVGAAIAVLEEIRENPRKAKKLVDGFFSTYYGSAKTDN